MGSRVEQDNCYIDLLLEVNGLAKIDALQDHQDTTIKNMAERIFTGMLFYDEESAVATRKRGS